MVDTLAVSNAEVVEGPLMTEMHRRGEIRSAIVWLLAAIVLSAPLLFALLHPNMYTDVEYELVRSSAGNVDAERAWLDGALADAHTAENRALLAEGYSVAGMPKLIEEGSLEALPQISGVSLSIDKALVPRQPFTSVGTDEHLSLQISGSAFVCSNKLGESEGTCALSDGQQAYQQIAACGMNEEALNDVAYRLSRSFGTYAEPLEVYCLTAHVNTWSATQAAHAEGYESLPFSMQGTDETVVIFIDQQAHNQLVESGSCSCFVFVPRLNAVGSGNLQIGEIAQPIE